MAIVFMLFSIIFCYTFNGYCIGDNFLTTIGLKAWSNGMHGTHYTVFYSFGILLVSFILYAFTTCKKLMTFLYFISGFSIIFIISLVLSISISAFAVESSKYTVNNITDSAEIKAYMESQGQEYNDNILAIHQITFLYD